MIIKGVKPQTQLVIDSCLFALLGIVAVSGLVGHATPEDEWHLKLMLHALHIVAGVTMCLVISLHLFLHLPWIQSQLRRVFQS